MVESGPTDRSPKSPSLKPPLFGDSDSSVWDSDSTLWAASFGPKSQASEWLMAVQLLKDVARDAVAVSGAISASAKAPVPKFRCPKRGGPRPVFFSWNVAKRKITVKEPEPYFWIHVELESFFYQI